MSPRFSAALMMASTFHITQVRKGKGIPYIAHPLQVASTLLKYGYDEHVAIGGLLHDLAEDQGGKKTLKRIEDNFGPVVAMYVEECSDTFDEVKGDWRARKEHHLAQLPYMNPGSLAIIAADKLDNTLDTLRDFRDRGDEAFTVFKGGKEGMLWYLDNMAQTLHRLENNPLTKELFYTVITLVKEVAEK